MYNTIHHLIAYFYSLLSQKSIIFRDMIQNA